MFKRYRDIPHHFIITIGALRKGDLKLFFGQDSFPEDGISCNHHRHYDSKITWEDIAADLEIMPSKTQARKNGWTGEISWGYSEHKKKFHRFFILNLEPTDERTKEINNGPTHDV